MLTRNALSICVCSTDVAISTGNWRAAVTAGELKTDCNWAPAVPPEEASSDKMNISLNVKKK